MMSEITELETQKLKEPKLSDYKEIKSESGISPKEAQDYWNSKLANTRESLLEHSNKDTLESYPIQLDTINKSLENKLHPDTGVPFVRKIVQVGNEKFEGVFPVFDSKFDAKIPEDMYLKNDATQFKECNKQLLKEIEANPELKKQFSPEQLDQIKDGVNDGTAPDGFVWHHDAEAGKLQLVDAEIHAKTGHTGGRYVWGGGRENR